MWDPKKFRKEMSSRADRHKRQHMHPGSTCASMSSFCTRGHATWVATGTSLEVAPPCSGVAFLAAVPTPFARIASVLKYAILEKKERHVDDAIQLMQNSRPGDLVVPRPAACVAPSCSPVFGSGQFDNYMTRFLLGPNVGRRIRWGEITEDHFQRALAKLRKFDVVVPLDRLSNALPAIQCTLGADYDLGADGDRYNWSMHANVHQNLTSTLRQKLLRLEPLVNKQNVWDLKLYNASVSLWNNHQCGSNVNVAKGNAPTLLLYMWVGIQACLSVVQGALS